jgi:hypothetical protein
MKNFLLGDWLWQARIFSRRDDMDIPRVFTLFCYNLIHDAWTDASAIVPPLQDWISVVPYSFLSISPGKFGYAGWKWIEKRWHYG